MTSTEQIYSWRNDWLTSIAEIADIEEQRRRWLNKHETNPHYSFIEYVNSYFDSFGESDYGDFVLDNFVTNEEAACVKSLHTLLTRYKPPNGDEFDHLAILSDEGWLMIVEAAASAVVCLRKLVTVEEAGLLLR